jgi:hypothetical protein
VPADGANTAAFPTRRWNRKISTSSTSSPIIAKKHRGPDDDDNLAWACIFCNLYKGPNLASLDPETGALTRLFHPRLDRWDDHFRQDVASIVGLTAVGRTTCWLLEMNSEVLSTLRTGLIREGQW